MTWYRKSPAAHRRARVRREKIQRFWDSVEYYEELRRKRVADSASIGKLEVVFQVRLLNPD